MLFKRKWFIRIFILVLVLTGMGVLIWTNLPALLTPVVEKRLAMVLKTDAIQCRVAHVGLTGILLSDMVLSSGVSVDNLRIH